MSRSLKAITFSPMSRNMDKTHRVALFGRAAIIVLLMWEPLKVASDSEEEVVSEWMLWKKHNEVSYDEKVNYKQFLKSYIYYTCKVTHQCFFFLVL